MITHLEACLTQPEEHPGLVDQDRAVPVVERGVGNRLRFEDAGVVHEDIDAAVLFDDAADDAGPVAFAGHVVVQVGDGIAELLGGCGADVVEHVGDVDRCARCGEQFSLGGTLAACAAGDQCHLVVEPSQ